MTSARRRCAGRRGRRRRGRAHPRAERAPRHARTRSGDRARDPAVHRRVRGRRHGGRRRARTALRDARPDPAVRRPRRRRPPAARRSGGRRYVKVLHVAADGTLDTGLHQFGPHDYGDDALLLLDTANGAGARRHRRRVRVGRRADLAARAADRGRRRSDAGQRRRLRPHVAALRGRRSQRHRARRP